VTNFHLPLDTLIIITSGWKKQWKTVKYAYYCSYYLRHAFNPAAIHTSFSSVKFARALISFRYHHHHIHVTSKACPGCYPTDMISMAAKVWSWPFSSVQVWSRNSTPFHNVACTCQDSLFHLSLFTYLLRGAQSWRSWPVLGWSKKFPAFYENWRSITAFTSAHHLYLTWGRTIQSAPPPPIALPEDPS
jgi:hypothetical protein